MGLVDDHDVDAAVEVGEPVAGGGSERRQPGELAGEVEAGPVEHGRCVRKTRREPRDLGAQRSARARDGRGGQVEHRAGSGAVDDGAVGVGDVVAQLGLLAEPRARTLGDDEVTVPGEAQRFEVRDVREVVGERPALAGVGERRGSRLRAPSTSLGLPGVTASHDSPSGTAAATICS